MNKQTTRAGKLLKRLNKRKSKTIEESPPQLTRQTLPWAKSLGFMSKHAAESRYISLGNLSDQFSNLTVFKGKSDGQFRVGFLDMNPSMGEEEYRLLCIIEENESGYLKDPKQITGLKSPYQIGLIQTIRSSQGQGLAKELYLFLISQGYEIFSDNEQFLGGYWLWKSISRSDKINVYVWDDLKKDYLRDDKGALVRYDGSNIPEDLIWSDDESKLHTLLVSTKNRLE